MKIHDDPEDPDYQTAMRLNMRKISDQQYETFEGYMAEIFTAFGYGYQYARDHRYPQAVHKSNVRCDGRV